MIIGIVGSIASGKDTVADYLKEKGFQAISLSDILRGIMKEENIEITTANMTEYGNKLRNEKGNGFLAIKAYEKINQDNAIITSIRQVGEVEFLKSNPKFYLVKLDAPIEKRVDRLVKRGREGDIKNIDELKTIEAKQADGKGGDMNMNKCFAMADYTLINDGTFEDLYKKVDELLEKINK